MAIQFDGVSFSYYKQKIVEEITFNFEKEHTYVLLGESGVGKSTLLSLIKGLQQPDKGKIKFNETSPEKVEIVFQDLRLFPWQTVKQAVEMPLKISKMAKAERNQRVDFLLEELKIQTIRDHYPSQLSGGQKQRTAMARGLVTDPDFLLLDEPTSSLDQKTKEKTQEFILLEQKKRKSGLIVVTHDTEEAAYLGETIIILRDRSFQVFQNPIFHLENRRNALGFYEFSIHLRKILEGAEQ